MTRLTQVPDDAAPGSSWFRTLASKEDYARAEALDRLCERLYGKSLQVFGETMSGRAYIQLVSTEGADAGQPVAYDTFNMTPKWKNWVQGAEKRLDKSHGEHADPPMGKNRREDPPERTWRAEGYAEDAQKLDGLA